MYKRGERRSGVAYVDVLNTVERLQMMILSSQSNKELTAEYTNGVSNRLLVDGIDTIINDADEKGKKQSFFTGRRTMITQIERELKLK